MGLLKGIGGVLAAGRLKKGYGSAAKAAAFKPFNIRTGFGSATFDKKRNATATLNPEYQAMKDKLLGLSGGFLDSIKGFDPNVATGEALALMRSLAQPEENRQYLNLENRLFSQGRLGAADAGGANPQMRALYEAFGQADTARQLQSIQLGQSLLDANIKRGMGFLSGAQGLDKDLLEMIQTGLYGGKAAAESDKAVADYKMGSAQVSADAITGFFSGLEDTAKSGGWKYY